MPADLNCPLALLGSLVVVFYQCAPTEGGIGFVFNQSKSGEADIGNFFANCEKLAVEWEILDGVIGNENDAAGGANQAVGDLESRSEVMRALEWLPTVESGKQGEGIIAVVEWGGVEGGIDDDKFLTPCMAGKLAE